MSYCPTSLRDTKIVELRSKERRVDPQIVVGLLIDRTGFPLEIGCFEGSKAETHTIIPVIKTGSS